MTIVDIFNQAKGKRLTYFIYKGYNGFEFQSWVTYLKIDAMNDKIAYIRGENGEWNEFITIPIAKVDDIEEIEDDKKEIEEAEAEYFVTFEDGSTLYIQILAELS